MVYYFEKKKSFLYCENFKLALYSDFQNFEFNVECWSQFVYGNPEEELIKLNPIIASFGTFLLFHILKCSMGVTRE